MKPLDDLHDVCRKRNLHVALTVTALISNERRNLDQLRVERKDKTALASVSARPDVDRAARELLKRIA